MPGATSRLSLVLPLGADAPSEYRTSITTNANTLDNAALWGSGTAVSRPSSTTVGSIYEETDTGLVAFYSHSAAWKTLLQYTSGTLASRPSSAPGTVYESTDVGVLQYYSASAAWMTLTQLMPVTTTTNLTAEAGTIVLWAKTTSGTITLPAATPGAVVGVTIGGSVGACNVVPPSGTIFGPEVGSVSTWVMNQGGKTCLFAPNASGTWTCISGDYDTAWVAPGSFSGIANSGEAVQMRQINGTCYLRGAPHTTSALGVGHQIFATGFTPVQAPMMPTTAVDASGNAGALALNAGSGGGITTSSPLASGVTLALSGLSYVVTS